MEKQKNQAVSTIRYYWNLATLAQRFEAEVEASPEDIANAFNALGGEVVMSAMNRHFKHVRTYPVEPDQIYTFDVRLVREMSPAFLPNVRAKGRIVRSEGYGTTIIRGDLNLGWFATAGLIFAFTASVIGVGLSFILEQSGIQGLFVLAGMMIAFAVAGASYYNTYLIIRRDIEQIIQNASQVEMEEAEDNLLIGDDDLQQRLVN